MHLQYPQHDFTGGFSFASALLDEDDFYIVMQDKNVVECEERTFGNYEGIYLKYNDLAEDGSFDQRIYLLCPDLYRICDRAELSGEGGVYQFSDSTLKSGVVDICQ